jgi:nitrite reductase/ring-hydroxylating ferredoxin subunit
MAEKHILGLLGEFPPGKPCIRRIGRKELGIFNIGGRFYGLPNVCPHQTGPLCEAPMLTGTVESSAESNWQLRWIHDGEVIRCPWHGLEFHVPTGQCLAYPEIRLRSYEVVVEDGIVSVLI